MFDERICCCHICGKPIPIFGSCPSCELEKQIMIDEMFKSYKEGNKWW